MFKVYLAFPALIKGYMKPHIAAQQWFSIFSGMSPTRSCKNELFPLNFFNQSFIQFNCPQYFSPLICVPVEVPLYPTVWEPLLNTDSLYLRFSDLDGWQWVKLWNWVRLFSSRVFFKGDWGSRGGVGTGAVNCRFSFIFWLSYHVITVPEKMEKHYFR